MKRIESIRKMRIFLTLLLTCVIGITSMTQVSATEQERQLIRVGFFASDGYHMESKEGIRSGYGYDFLKMAENYNNWKYEYVGYDKGWKEMLKMLENGQIDILTYAQKTPEREALFDYSDQPIGTSDDVLVVRREDDRYEVGEPSTYSGMRIGMEKGTTHPMSMETFADENHFTYTPVYYDNRTDMKKDLEAGKNIDGMIISNFVILEHEKVIDEMKPIDFYAIVKKGNTALLEQVNHAISQMDKNTPGWRLELKNKYYASNYADEIMLDKKEITYLQECRDSGKVFQVATNPDLSPYSSYQNGVATGIVPEIFDEIAKRLDLPYEYVPFDTYEEYNQFVKDGKADIDLTCYSDYGLAEFHGVSLTNPYLETSMALLTTGNTNQTNVIAELKNSQKNTTFTTDLFNAKRQIIYATNAECIKAVLNGTVDGVYLYTYQAQQAVEQDPRNRLTYTILPEYQISMAFGVNQNIDYRVLSVLNKGVSSVKGNYSAHVIQQQITSLTEKKTLLGMIYDYPAIAMTISGLILITIFLICFLAMISKNRKAEVIYAKELERQKNALEDALEMANSASKAKGLFLSKMSHEIRTPLNAVIGYMQIAKDAGENTTKISHCIENSDIAAKHLLRIINDVLDISSIESGKMKIAHEEFNLKNQLTSIATMFFHQAKEKDITFAVKMDGITQEWVIGDSMRVNQILLNLLSNAVKFTPEGGTITLKVTQADVEKDHKVFMKFYIQDTGIGMSEEYKKRLFKPFEQESAVTAQKYGGTGLGLSITYNLVQMMGGSIEVESRQNEGTTFVVSLHFDQSENNRVSVPQQNFSSVRALIVNTDPADCEYMKELCKRYQIKSDIVKDGESTIKQLKRRMGTEYQYHLVIMDWNIQNAIETVKRIKEECKEAAPTIIATAYDTIECEEEAEKIGVYKVIRKPVFQSTLFDLLLSLYGKYEPQKEQDINLENLQGIRVLLAEDNPMNTEIAVDILKKAGLVVDTVEDGKQAYERFTGQPEDTYDVILMDIQMPVMDGYQATGAIRRSSHPEAKTIPIIAMTANAFAEDVTAALTSGMNGHIAKPVNYDKLYEVLNENCKKVQKS